MSETAWFPDYRLTSSFLFLLSCLLCSIIFLFCDETAQNEQGKRKVNRPTLFFMIHCGLSLVNNVLWANWNSSLNSHIVIVGNPLQKVFLFFSFSFYVSFFVSFFLYPLK